VTARSLALRALLVAVLFAAVVLLLGALVPGARAKLADADPAWLALAVVLELCACAGYAALFHAVFARPPYVIKPRRSTEIALAELGGFAVVPAGIGGPAARIWGLRREGMTWRDLGIRSVAHVPIFNAPYVIAALLLGLAVALGTGPGKAPLAVALAPAGLIAVAALLVAAIARGTRRRRAGPPDGWRSKLTAVLRLVPIGVRETPALLRDPRAVLGSLGYWVGDCAVLWASFHAVGVVPPVDVIVLGYLLGQLGNLVPLPGGVGGVEPVMLGVLTASGVGAGSGAAAIICYRAIALGVQAGLGAIAFAALAPRLGGSRPAPVDPSG
jgi:uncharacterized membrane protein YbhN (UPF0104 family)